MMENREYLNNLYDIYKELLTTKEQENFCNYYMEDLSLSEIAENNNVSKANVSKILKQVEKKLNNYENILGIYKIKENLNKLLEMNNLEEIKKIIKSILS